MSDPESSVALSVDHLKVDKVSIWNSDRTSTLVKITPLLSVMITALALLVSSSIQIWQNQMSEIEKKDSAWRSALEKISPEDKQAIAGALELQTFFNDKHYSEHAHALAAAILPRITDPDAFDTALYENGGKRSFHDQHYATIARGISHTLYLQYVLAKQNRPDQLPADASFVSFLQHPENFFDVSTQFEQLHTVQNEVWKLDSVISILSDTWRTAKLRSVSPTLDLSGIVFLGHDFSGIDFRPADMEGSSFAGSCLVDTASVPAKVPVQCAQSSAAAAR